MNNILKTSCVGSDLDINKEIPLFFGASEEFIQEALKLEAISDLNERSKEAIKFITENNLKTSFNYSIINEMLHNPYEYPLSDWRNLYLIERSIPPRNSKYSWLQRIKIFNNTNLIETGIVNLGIAPNGNKFYWRKGTEKHPTNHDSLHMGKGEPLADFYFYDDTAGETTREKMISTECKYSNFDTVELGAEHFRTDHSYGVRYLMLYHAKDSQYYLIDYKENIIIPQPQIKPAGELLDIYKSITNNFK